MGTLCRERKLRVAKKRATGRYPKAFRKMAVERLKRSDNIVALSQELRVHRRLLYKWRDQLEPRTSRRGRAGAATAASQEKGEAMKLGTATLVRRLAMRFGVGREALTKT